MTKNSGLRKQEKQSSYRVNSITFYKEIAKVFKNKKTKQKA